MGLIVQPDNCNILPKEFLQLLASAVMVDGNTGYAGLNVTLISPDRYCDCDPFVTCDNNHLPPEAILRNIFVLDGCGKHAIRLINCDGSAVPDEEGEPQ